MIRVGDLIAELKKYPDDALAYGYEGECQGIVVVDKAGPDWKELGFIETKKQ